MLRHSKRRRRRLLGGKDWDEKLVEIAAERLKMQIGQDPRKDPATLHELIFAAEAAKRMLSERTKATLVVHHGGQRLKVDEALFAAKEITRDCIARHAAWPDDTWLPIHAIPQLAECVA